MVCTYDIFYDRWRSCTISYAFGTLPDRIGAYRYISAITTSCDRLIIYKVKYYASVLLCAGLHKFWGSCGPFRPRTEEKMESGHQAA